MKKRIIAIICLLAICFSCLPGCTSDKTATDGLYNVGYAKADVNPWVETEKVSYLHPETGTAGVPMGTWWDWEENVVITQVYDPADGETKEVYFIRIPMSGFGDIGSAITENLYDDNGDGHSGPGDGLAVTVTSVTDDWGNTVMYITIDSIGGYAQLTEAVRKTIPQALEEKVGKSVITPDRIMVSANHSHSSVNLQTCSQNYKLNSLVDDTPTTAVGAYWCHYVDTVTQAAVEAYTNATPATMKKGAIDVAEAIGSEMSFVRHYEVVALKKDNTQETAISGPHFGPSGGDSATHSIVSKKQYLTGNNQMQVLEFIPENGDKPVVMVNWQAHSTFVGSSQGKFVSADYASSLRRFLEEAGFRPAFWQGAAGNLVPNSGDSSVSSAETYWANIPQPDLDISSEDGGKNSPVVRYGKLLSKAAIQCLQENMVSVETGRICTKQTQFDIKLKVFEPTGAMAMAAREWEALGKPSSVYPETSPKAGERVFPFIYTDASGEVAILNSYYHANKTLTRVQSSTASEKTELNVILLGKEVAMVTSCNELFDRYDLEGSILPEDNDWLDLIGESYGKPFVLGYTNSHGTYAASVQACDYNKDSETYGTGAYEDNTSQYARGEGERMIAEFGKMLAEVLETYHSATEETTAK